MHVARASEGYRVGLRRCRFQVNRGPNPGADPGEEFYSQLYMRSKSVQVTV